VKALIVLPLSFLFQFSRDIIIRRQVTVFAELSLHILIIGMLYLLSMLTSPHWSPEHEPLLFVFKACYKLAILAMHLLFFYLNVFWFIPGLLGRKRYAWYCCALVLLFCVSIAIETGIYHLPVFPAAQTAAFMSGIKTDLLLKFLIILASFLYKFSKDWFRHEALQKKLESEKVVAELALLKFQIHPHFLFNTLNNIYSLAMQEGSPRTVQSLAKLGGMMHYMLEECQQDHVSLAMELEYLKHYITLQQLRLDEQNRFTMEMDISGYPDRLKIAPMLLISFIENAFKHGISIRDPSFINLKIAISESEFQFNIKNSVHSRKENLNGTGLGLKNVKQRLMMLYPKRHTLVIAEKDRTFNVRLNIMLDHV
jgi:two-component system, LytTR family, sensor kinase